MSAPRPFVLFSESPSSSALALLESAPATLPLTRNGGEVFGQFVTDMTFADAASRTEFASP